MTKYLHLIATALLLALLQACGGGAEIDELEPAGSSTQPVSCKWNPRVCI